VVYGGKQYFKFSHSLYISPAQCPIVARSPPDRRPIADNNRLLDVNLLLGGEFIRNNILALVAFYVVYKYMTKMSSNRELMEIEWQRKQD
jgi:hypothetical protein